MKSDILIDTPKFWEFLGEIFGVAFIKVCSIDEKNLSHREEVLGALSSAFYVLPPDDFSKVYSGFIEVVKATEVIIILIIVTNCF